MTTFLKIPVVIGTQGGFRFYSASLSAGQLVQLVRFTDASLPVKDRAQRLVSQPDAKAIADYIQADSHFTFQSIELSVAGSAEFEPIPGHPSHGYLILNDKTPVYADDGQTRTAAYKLAIALNEAIATDEDVKVTFEVDSTLDRRRKRFSDYNLKRRKVCKALGLYFSEDPEAQIVRQMIESSEKLFSMTLLTQDTIPKNGQQLFAYNGLFEATSVLLIGQEELTLLQQAHIALDFWLECFNHIPDWQAVFDKQVTAAQIRGASIHCQAIALIGIATVGQYMLKRHSKDWKQKLANLQKVDWRRDNPNWQGRVIFHKSIKKNPATILGMVCLLKSEMGLPLSSDEQAFESNLEQEL